jgi:CheY-like chemotaxis protein
LGPQRVDDAVVAGVDGDEDQRGDDEHEEEGPTSRVFPIDIHERLSEPEGPGSVFGTADQHLSEHIELLETLAGTGYELREAADGEEALERIAARRPDAIVLDLMMPKLDGFAVLERLQGDPATRRIPVIVLTARALMAAERSLLQRRAVSLLEKNDYSGEELRSLVQRALG